MGLFETFVLAVGLSMDAFAVAICKGLALGRPRLSSALVVGLWFGAFQALMPLIGYVLGVQFESYIQRFDHWVAFILLAMIGGNMIREALSAEEEDQNDSISVRAMLPLAVATSIDALASGVALAAGHGLKAGSAAMGKAFAEARLELDLKTLKPAFADTLPFTAKDSQADAAQPSILSIVARKKKKRERSVPRSGGILSVCKGI